MTYKITRQILDFFTTEDHSLIFQKIDKNLFCKFMQLFEDGGTPLHCAVQYFDHILIDRLIKDLDDSFLTFKILNLRDANGRTPEESADHIGKLTSKEVLAWHLEHAIQENDSKFEKLQKMIESTVADSLRIEQEDLFYSMISHYEKAKSLLESGARTIEAYENLSRAISKARDICPDFALDILGDIE
jgi:hypothetical protein